MQSLNQQVDTFQNGSATLTLKKDHNVWEKFLWDKNNLHTGLNHNVPA